ncbi:aminodeoxychorismate synthase component I [Haliangium sp.]|uniref:aminodeoxychorismate synthase component I n=1 Tax=Haliangium sp. TaxID=2663208 RepID=UPI003D103C96
MRATPATNSVLSTTVSTTTVPTKTLLIDNYDSFTFNLFHLLAAVNGVEPDVVRNDQLGFDEVDWAGYDNVVLSPGPGTPLRAGDVGLGREVIARAALPLLGVCLGHQAIGHACGARVAPAPVVMHGRLSRVRHDGRGLFAGLPDGFEAVRYHSLVLAPEPRGGLPGGLIATAWSDDGVIMAIRHRHRPLWGVQFHPESILSEHGRALMHNFRRLSRDALAPRGAVSVASKRSRVSMLPRGQARAESTDRWRVQHRRLAFVPDPEAAFASLWAGMEYCFWLDSSQAGPDGGRFAQAGAGGGRFSMMGGTQRPRLRLEYWVSGQRLRVVDERGERWLRTDAFSYLRRWLQEHQVTSAELPFDFNGGLVGYFGYEMKAECGGDDAHRSPYPDAQWLLADRMLVFDHHEGCAYLVCLTEAGGEAEAEAWFDEASRRLAALEPVTATPPRSGAAPIEFSLSRSQAQYLADIERCFELIRAGETYEVCLTAHLRSSVSIDPHQLHRALRSRNPAPYAAFFKLGELAIVSSSPERFLRVDPRGGVEARPIKGTAPRGHTAEHDAALRLRLASAEKERAENLMIVDLLRNDLGAVCELGSVEVPALMEVESFATVHQLVSTIRGRLRPDMHAIDCVRAAFPGGSMTGAPKRRTMRIIDELEQEARGIYSGAIGYLSLSGAADLNIVIRTAVITAGELSIGVGGAIVALSDAEAECDEALLKARALIEAAVHTVHGEVRPELFSIDVSGAASRRRGPRRALR